MKESGKIIATLGEKTETWLWLKEIALGGGPDWRKAAIALYEITDLHQLVREQNCGRYDGCTALDCAKRIRAEGINYPVCKWCSALACVELP